jgi:DNA-binding transcriptional MocR family regulator
MFTLLGGAIRYDFTVRSGTVVVRTSATRDKGRDPTMTTTLVEQLQQKILAGLMAGQPAADEMLPSFAQLQDLVGARGVSTVQTALDPFLAIGAVQGEGGRGTRVLISPLRQQHLEQLAALGVRVPVADTDATAASGPAEGAGDVRNDGDRASVAAHLAEAAATLRATAEHLAAAAAALAA